MEYTLIIPVYKAEKTLPFLIPIVIKSMDSVSGSYEIVLVDDHSPDNSWSVLCNLQQQYRQVRIIRLEKNFGQLAATTCGIRAAKGNVLITMDDDLQFSPGEIPAMISYYNAHNYQLVFGVAEKKANSRSLDYTRTTMRFLFRNIFLTGFRNVEYFSSFRIMNATLAQKGKLENLFMIWKLLPEEIGNFPVQHFPTQKQHTSYTFLKRVMHFSPYLILGFQKTGLFALALLAIAAFVFPKQSIWRSTAIAFLVVACLLVAVLSFLYLRKTEKVVYSIQSSRP